MRVGGVLLGAPACSVRLPARCACLLGAPACSVRNCEFFELHHPMFRFGLEDAPLDINGNGCLHLPTGPGLGVELDWDWIDDNTVLTLSGLRD